jgi:hypothetical protein
MSHVFQKLGVNARRELAPLLREELRQKGLL